VQRNAESIYGTSANPFGELDWGYCTVKGNKLYLFIRDWPKDNILTVSGVNNSVTSAYMLVDKSKQLTVRKVENKVLINLPAKAPDDPVSVLVLEIDGPPRVNPPMVVQNDTGKIELNYLTAISHGKSMTRFNRKGGFHISKWTGPEDAVDWHINVTRPGKFKINVNYAANKEWEGKLYEITAGKSNIENRVICTGDWYEYKEFPVGYIEFDKTGEYTLTIRPKVSSETYLMYLRSITLNPVEGIKNSGWGVN
jgi:alpha-L-fucosidase